MGVTYRSVKGSKLTIAEADENISTLVKASLGIKTYSLSARGIISDADISIGSSSFGIDQTDSIQAILNLAIAGPIKIIWDVAVSVTGLKVYDNTTIEGISGYGVILRPFSNKAVFQNSGWNDSSHSWNPSLDDTKFINNNIRINGIIINGNGANANGSQQIHSSAATGWICPVRMFCTKNFSMDRCIILGQKTFSIHLMNTKYTTLTNGSINCGPYGIINTDGIHYSGANSDITIHNWVIAAYDDHIGLNADDGLDHDTFDDQGNNNFQSNSTYYQGSAGMIDRWDIQNIRFNGGIFGLRFLSGASKLGSGTVKGLSGKTVGYALVIDNYWQHPSFIYASGPGNIDAIVVEDINVESTATYSGVNVGLVNINCNASLVVLKNIRRFGFSVNNFPTVHITGVDTRIKELQVIDLISYESSSTNTNTAQILVNAAKVDRIKCINSSVIRESSTSDSPLIATVNNALVNTVQLVEVSMVNCLNVVFDATTSGGIKTVIAHNVEHLGTGIGGSFKTSSIINQISLDGYFGSNAIEGGFNTKIGTAFTNSVAPPPTYNSGDLIEQWDAVTHWVFPSNWTKYDNTSGNDALGTSVYYTSVANSRAKMQLYVPQAAILKLYGNKSTDYTPANLYLNGVKLSPIYSANAATSPPDNNTPIWIGTATIPAGTHTLEFEKDSGNGISLIDRSRLFAA